LVVKPIPEFSSIFYDNSFIIVRRKRKITFKFYGREISKNRTCRTHRALFPICTSGSISPCTPSDIHSLSYVTD
jgi:hypothetical protein